MSDCEQTTNHKQWEHLNTNRPSTDSIEIPTISCRHVEGQLGNAVVSEELVRSHEGALDFCVVPIKSSTEEKNHQKVVAVEYHNCGSSIIFRIARFILNWYSVLCGRRSFRANH